MRATGQMGRVQSRQIGLVSLKADDRVVRAELGVMRVTDLAVLGRGPRSRSPSSEAGRSAAVGRDGHPVAAPLIPPLPEQLLAGKVDAHELLDRADVEPLGPALAQMPLTLLGTPLAFSPAVGIRLISRWPWSMS